MDPKSWERKISGRVPSLDGLRAVSIISVIGFHQLNAVARPHTGKDYKGPLKAILNGELGVSIFFVISGFLITTLLLRELRSKGKINFTGFYLRRIFRIWPAFFTYLIVIALLVKLHVISMGSRDLIAAALFVFNYVPHVGSWWVGHSWSLSIEEQFYFIWPPVLIFASPKNAARIAVAALLTVPLVRLAELCLLPANNFFVVRMWEMTHTRIDTILFGCALALIADRHAFFKGYSLAIRFRLHFLALAYLVLSPFIDDRLPSELRDTISWSIQGLCISLIMIWCIDSSETLVFKFLNSKPVVHIGVISYSLYLWQQVFFVSLNKSFCGRLPWNLICVAIIAEASFLLVEQPMLSLRRKLSQNRKSKPLRVVSEDLTTYDVPAKS